MPAPRKNDYALDNDGGPPPENQNAQTHGLHSDPANLLDHLQENEPEAFRWIQDKYASYLEDAPFSHDSAKADQLKQVVVREYSIWVASGLMVREGVIKTQAVQTGDGDWIEAEKEHAVAQPLDRMEKTVTRRLKELGVLGDDPGPTKQDGTVVMESSDYIIEMGPIEDSEDSGDGEE